MRSPGSAARERELREELGLDRRALQLLVTDWAPHPDEGDKILYIFDCGDLGQDETRIRLDSAELDRWSWVNIDQVPEYVIPRLAKRLGHAYQARISGQSAYIEHGDPADPSRNQNQSA